MHFTDELYTFFGDLAENNERDWFQANKKRYGAAVKAPALQFTADDFMDRVMAIFASAAPLNAFICRALGLPF